MDFVSLLSGAFTRSSTTSSSSGNKAKDAVINATSQPAPSAPPPPDSFAPSAPSPSAQAAPAYTTSKIDSLNYPNTYEDRQLERSNSSIIWLLVIAIIVFIIVVAILFTSFRSVSSAVTDAVVVATDVATALVDTANKALAKIADVVEAAIDLVADLVRYLRQAMEAILVPAYETIKSFFEALYGFFAPIATNLYNWFSDTISAVLGIWDSYIVPFFEQLTGYANDLLSALGLN